ncbi:hydroxyethylthiazole kinase [Streptococcus penaeicida]|uniref:Hydroxyethylthiazole kinase n=1 Tax=Streptococcus penaeicida TaxID=1765960 RepID=A0A2N8LC84_9STRE|nr:hydroxyethylthiazole kinase [Streptococcus penaeicida]PND47769.1 hydroxyethylthiazole kinase [Streptococcus penaeicida]
MFLEKLRESKPFVISMTNDVVKNFTANGLLALGAVPAMSDYVEDLRDMLKVANGLLINIGTLSEKSLENYQAAIKIASENNVPVVLDPVAAGASQVRLAISQELVKNHPITILRGNASEIAALLGEKQESKGPDGGFIEDVAGLALRAEKAFQMPVVITGERDAIALDGSVTLLENGSAMMPLVTGTGCLLGAVLAAFIAVADPSQYKDCLIEALSSYNIAGELAEEASANKGPGSYQIAFLDALYNIKDKDVEERIKVSHE